MHKIDLHIHSNYSDGKSDCRDIVRLAARQKIEIFSITDHDTLCGLEETIETAKELSLTCVPGIEISTSVEDMLHILGYRINWRDESFCSFVKFCQKQRFERAKKFITSLNKHGLTITLADVLDLVKSSPSRVHIAQVLVEKKYAFSRGEAFKKFLTPSSPTYVRPTGVSTEDAISAINKAGGVAVLAHPGVTSVLNIPQWVNAGLKAIEAFYPRHSKTETNDYINTADKYGIFVTAGSDYHGPDCGFSTELGAQVPDEVFNVIKEKLI